MRAIAKLFALLTTLAALLLLPTAALADHWRVTKLRGPVLQLVEGAWAPLRRGDIVPDDRVLRTLPRGRVELQRGAETVSLGGETQVQIHDLEGRRFTTVQQYFGTVTIEADVRNVEHFAVQTPYLAAVVKGTRFTVTTGSAGVAVEVERGNVGVLGRITRVRETVPAGSALVMREDGAFAKGTAEELQLLLDAAAPAATGAASAGQLITLLDKPANAAASGPGNSANAPGQNKAQSGSGSSPGNSGNAPGQNKPNKNSGAPGNSGNAPGRNR